MRQSRLSTSSTRHRSKATRESFALKAAAADVREGPATDLLREAGQEVVDRHTGEAAVDLRDKDALRAVGLEQVAGVLPVLGRLPADAAEQVRAWILGIAAQVAEAAYDIGQTEEISDTERRALDAIRGVLSA